MKIFTLAKYIKRSKVVVYQDKLYRVDSAKESALQSNEVTLRLSMDVPAISLDVNLPVDAPIQVRDETTLLMVELGKSDWARVEELHLERSHILKQLIARGTVTNKEGQQQPLSWKGSHLSDKVKLCMYDSYGHPPHQFPYTDQHPGATKTLLEYLTLS